MDTSERAVYRGQITKLVNCAKDYLASSDSAINESNDLSGVEEELVSYIERLSVAKSVLDRINGELKSFIKPENSAKEYESICDYEDKATGMLARLKQRLKSVRSCSDRAISGIDQPRGASERARGSGSGYSKLPKLTLKVFSGNFVDWIPFWETFRTAVHENQDLTGAEKFNYLSTHLAGKALDCISGFTPSSANYDAAVSLLLEQFGDSDRLVSHIMQQLMNLPRVTSRHDTSGLRKLYTEVITYTRSLTVLSVPSTQYSIMLKTLLLRCLPRELVLDYHRTHSNEKHASQSPASDTDDENASVSVHSSANSLTGIQCDQLRSILSYIKQEVSSLESTELSVEKKLRTQLNIQTKSFKTATGLLAPAKEIVSVCKFCNWNTHTTDQCKANISLMEKKAILKSAGCCFKCIKKGHHANKCFNKRIKCYSCGGGHATSMCDPEFKARPLLSTSTTNTSKTKLNSIDNNHATALCSSSAHKTPAVLLQTARVVATNGPKSLLVRVILDGGSQRTYIKRSIASRLELPIYNTVNMQILSFGSRCKHSTPKMFERVKVKLNSMLTNEIIEILAVVVPDICPDVLQPPNVIESDLLAGFQLADDHRLGTTEDEIGVLLGADVYWTVVKGQSKRIKDNLVAVNTIFGWTVQGPVPFGGEELCTTVNLTIDELDDDLNSSGYANKHIEQLWRFDEISIATDIPVNIDELIEHHVKRNGKRYQASLLWKDENCLLADNRNGALIRFRKLVAKLKRDPYKLKEYDNIIREMISLGMIDRLNDQSTTMYYMPHRPVYRLDKETTRTRIVFDASSRAADSRSLNELLWSGPNLLPELLAILLNFRLGKYAIIADIEKAFLQIELDPKDCNVHCFFWLADLDDLQSIVTMVIKRLTFGVTCSPFLLCAVLRKHFMSSKHKYPETIKILLSCFYLDDLIVSLDEYDDAVRLYSESRAILSDASMNLRKWKTNDDRLRLKFEEPGISTNVKVLGVPWQIDSDELSIDVDKILPSTEHYLTKRTLLQTVATIYDPLGFLAPCVTKLKLLFQESWRQKLPWDQPLPVNMTVEFRKHTADFHRLSTLTLPRCVFIRPDREKQELHIFSDASPKAYGAVAYIRGMYQDGTTSVEFLCAKGRLAPIRSDASKDVTLPKMELAAAAVAAKLASYLKENLRMNFDGQHLWTDSKIALFWIVRGNSKRDVYIDNRVREIRRLADVNNWKHCPGSTNPADLLTRGITVRTMLSTISWRHGPEWLRSDESEWPAQDIDMKMNVTDYTLLIPNDDQPTSKEPIFPLENYSRFRRLIRVTAYILRFGKAVRGMRSDSKHITANELKVAECYWIKAVQTEAFAEEIIALRGNRNCPKGSKILSLNPFLDPYGILRVGTRLVEAEFSYDETFPVLLPKKSHFSWLLIHDAHERVLHGGTNMVLNQLRRRFWIIRARQAIKTVISKCTLCKRLKGKAADQPFAPLPKERMLSSRPFETAGIDFAGPLFTRISLDNTVTSKVYILLITCAVTRAVHLEMVSDLKAETCILALRRFFARRGVPALLMSDNAKTFQRAALEFRQVAVTIQSEQFQNYLSKNGISWKFIIERAAWWGGFWERLIKIVKDLLKVSIQRSTLTSEQLNTYISEVEFIINGRPLTYISDDCSDLSPLTPAHFLLGSFPSSLNTTAAKDAANEIRAKWQSRFRLANSFFRRFKTDYLQALRSVHHKGTTFFRELKEGEVVIVYDSSTPRLFWKLARIEKVFPGRDSRVRSCEIRFSNGVVLRRSIQHLYPLEVN